MRRNVTPERQQAFGRQALPREEREEVGRHPEGKEHKHSQRQGQQTEYPQWHEHHRGSFVGWRARRPEQGPAPEAETVERRQHGDEQPPQEEQELPVEQAVQDLVFRHVAAGGGDARERGHPGEKRHRCEGESLAEPAQLIERLAAGRVDNGSHR